MLKGQNSVRRHFSPAAKCIVQMDPREQHNQLFTGVRTDEHSHRQSGQAVLLHAAVLGPERSKDIDDIGMVKLPHYAYLALEAIFTKTIIINFMISYTHLQKHTRYKVHYV